MAQHSESHANRAKWRKYLGRRGLRCDIGVARGALPFAARKGSHCGRMRSVLLERVQRPEEVCCQRAEAYSGLVARRTRSATSGCSEHATASAPEARRSCERRRLSWAAAWVMEVARSPDTK